MQIKSSVPRHQRGFSLVEILVVISVIGVIASMAMASMTNVSENTKVIAAKANARNIAATFHDGLAAGSPAFKQSTDVSSAMNAVGTGGHGAGLLSGSTFVLKGVSATMDAGKPSIQQAKYYLSWENGTLIYSNDGAPAGSVEPDGENTSLIVPM